MSPTLQEFFIELFGRPPRAGELDHPYYVAQLRRFGAGNSLFTAQQLAQSNVLMAFPHIMDENGNLYYGGDQAWFAESVASPRRSIESFSGCGIVSAADMLASYAYTDEGLAGRLELRFHLDGSISKESFVALMRAAYHDIGTMELPGYAKRYRAGRYAYEEKAKRAAERRNTGKKKNDPVPPSLGVWGGRYLTGTVRLAKKYGLKLTPHALPTLYAGYDEGLDFITKGLAAGSPVDIFTTFNVHTMAVYDKGYGIAAKKRQNRQHHVVAVAVYDDAQTGDTEILVSTWGRLASISYRELHESWQTRKAVASGLYWFAPTNSDQKVQNNLRKHRGQLGKSVGLLFKGGLRRVVGGGKKAPKGNEAPDEEK